MAAMTKWYCNIKRRAKYHFGAFDFDVAVFFLVGGFHEDALYKVHEELADKT